MSFVESGFADPVRDAQSAFRAIMNALAHPGTVQGLHTPPSGPALHAGLCAAALTLVDHDTPVWLSPRLGQNADLRDFLAFHTGAPLTALPAQSAFALVDGAADLPPLQDFALGTDAYPDRSTTVVLAVPALENGPVLTARGPGIREALQIAPQDLPAAFAAQWQRNGALFPRGVDLLLVTENAVLGLPRTTKLSEG
jgi:alpha-D-ribose 1-methylphosphonate 5-triphosphate synthase subunit PhnH